MEITYLGHSAFQLKGKTGIVVTDPFTSSVGFTLPSVKADIVTISHDHEDHNYRAGVGGNAGKTFPYIIEHPGEYEIGGITVFGYPTYHDDQKGAERGANVMYSIFLDDVHVLHLGDLGHLLDQTLVESLPAVDVLLCPVGGVFTISAQQAIETVAMIEPGIVVPMHYRTDRHATEGYGSLQTLDEALKVFGKIVEPQDKLVVTAKASASDEEVETQVVVLNPVGKK